jgi:hypothetical protein
MGVQSTAALAAGGSSLSGNPKSRWKENSTPVPASHAWGDRYMRRAEAHENGNLDRLRIVEEISVM